jgi:hypothetical protein
VKQATAPKVRPAAKSLYEQFVELKATNPEKAGAFWRKHKAAITGANYSSMTRAAFSKLTPFEKSRFSKEGGKLVK